MVVAILTNPARALSEDFVDRSRRSMRRPEAEWSPGASGHARGQWLSGRSFDPGWRRAVTGRFEHNSPRVPVCRASAISLGNPGRGDIAVGQRVFHSKFGYGQVAEIEGNKLDIDFEHAGRKRVADSFVDLA